jgi:hypothetical protein
MYSGGTGGSSSGSPCRTGLVGLWSLGFITWSMKTLLSFCCCRPREHGLSQLKTGVDMVELIGISGVGSRL